MKLSFGQHLQSKQIQTQLQTLAPRMIQSMEILQMAQAALLERIEQELSENPILELREKDPSIPDSQSDQEAEDSSRVEEQELVVDVAHDLSADFERLSNLDQEFPEQFDERPRPSANRIREESDRQHDLMANVAGRAENLQDYLLQQLSELELDAATRRMCERIISALSPEDGGYLKVSLIDLLPAGAGPDQQRLADQALRIVQGLDPPGIAARDLRECLLLQITPETPLADELRKLVAHHLEDLRDNRLPQIQRATGFSIARIQEAWNQLRKLDPRPASHFAQERAPAIIPDMRVEQDENGHYVVRQDADPVRGLRISRFYRNRLMNGEATPEERAFIKRKLTAAQWLIDAIHQRRNTLTKVAQAIVDHQTAFLDQGPEHLEPLKMQQIADKVGVHVTTVSRAVDHKWIDTPRGIFPLKRFFVGGTRTDDGEDVAWDAIRIKLQELVDHEDKSKPYSDDELVKLLKAQGLNVARRTVTKYRQRMGIPSSRQRRDWSKSSGVQPLK